MKLGLDVSTTCCGWAFSEQGKIQDAGFIDISKLNSNKDKSFHIIGILKQNPLINNVKEINLEAALSGFAGGFTSQQVIIKLSRFNAILEYILGDELKIPINLLNVSTIRKKVFGKARLKGIKSKDYVKMMIPGIAPNYKVFEKLNKIGNWDKRNEDIYDAIVCSLY